MCLIAKKTLWLLTRNCLTLGDENATISAGHHPFRYFGRGRELYIGWVRTLSRTKKKLPDNNERQEKKEEFEHNTSIGPSPDRNNGLLQKMISAIATTTHDLWEERRNGTESRHCTGKQKPANLTTSGLLRPTRLKT